MATLFRTGNGTSTDTIICTLELVSPDWFRRALVGALELMCSEANWTQRGDADVQFARDKANEMLESLEVDVIIPKIEAGCTMMWFSAVAPDGWIFLHGQGISKITYPKLFAIFGYTYGGSGNTFSLPTMEDLIPIGAGGLVSLGEDAGSFVAGIEQTNLPTVNFPVTDLGHNHTVTDPGHSHAPASPGTSFFALNGSGRTTASGSGAGFIGNTASANTGISVQPQTTGISVHSGGSGTPVDILNPVRGVNFIIYAG